MIPASHLPTAPIIAIDTEFEDVHTLTIQAAMRLDESTVAVRIYYQEKLIPAPPDTQLLQTELMGPNRNVYERFVRQVMILPAMPITNALSPAQILIDLLDMRQATIHTRRQGYEALEQLNQQQSAEKGKPRRQKKGSSRLTPRINMTVVSHFQRADFARMFGLRFFAELQETGHPGRPLLLSFRKRPRLVEAGGSTFQKPVLQFIWSDSLLHAVSVDFQDTNLIFGSMSLDGQSRTFLGIPKCDRVRKEEKDHMTRVFNERTLDAYTYAVADPVNTLLIYEQMELLDRQIQQDFGISGDDLKPMGSTLGQRVSNFLVATTRQATGATKETVLKGTNLEFLMRRGGADLFAEHPELTHYGSQHESVHGGLLYSRAPTKFWHESPGMLRDVDMSGCYNSIIADLHVYNGQPKILEPGRKKVALAEGISLVQRLAPGGGWQIRASGKIDNYFNVLIPSTEDALTCHNYREKKRHTRRRQGYVQAARRERREDPQIKEALSARIYTKAIEFGIVTQDTWKCIQLLPPEVRIQYEKLQVDAIVFYPSILIARDITEYTELYRRFESLELPWEQDLDVEGMQIQERRFPDHDHVTLEYDIGVYARQIAAKRKQAQQAHGKGSGMDLAWKQLANTMYGVLASPHHVTQNLVAANQITARARARAFLLSQALNAIQTITDGCSYRKDQIPKCTYSECLSRKCDYPIQRAESGDGISFYNPEEIPSGETEFCHWLLDHMAAFYQVGRENILEIFGVLDLEHKKCGSSGSTYFDALGCDGAGNYIKATKTGNGCWQVEDFAARGYGKDAKRALQERLIRCYSTDNVTELLPIVDDSELLSLQQAHQKVRHCWSKNPNCWAVLPLGWKSEKALNYQIIKPSAFLFQTAGQRRKILKQIQKFTDRHGCGLEILAMRRTYKNRRQGSIIDLATVIYDQVVAGRTQLSGGLNMHKVNPDLEKLAQERLSELTRRKKQASKRLQDCITWNLMRIPAIETCIALTERSEFITV